MLDVASLKGLLPSAWRNIPVAQYFHENQLTFPWNEGDAEKVRGLTTPINSSTSSPLWRPIGFGSIHPITATCSSTPPSSSSNACRIAKHGYSMNALADKSSVLPVGIDAPAAVDVERPIGAPPTILWNHRWSNDKGPIKFAEHLNDLEAEGHDFKLILCGQQFAEVLRLYSNPFASATKTASSTMAMRIRMEAYTALLESSDFILHEPVQEYFGVSVAEAMSHGVIPILKSAQAYLSWVPNAFLFKHAEERSAQVGELAKGWCARPNTRACNRNEILLAPRGTHRPRRNPTAYSTSVDAFWRARNNPRASCVADVQQHQCTPVQRSLWQSIDLLHELCLQTSTNFTVDLNPGFKRKHFIVATASVVLYLQLAHRQQVT